MKRVTIREVADRAGVSIGTVSFVLNDTKNQSISEETRQKVLRAAAELHYTPNAIAKTLRSKKSMALAVVSYLGVSQGIFGEILEGIYEVCEQKGYALVLCPVRDDPYAFCTLYRQRRVDAAVIICPNGTGIPFDEAGNVRAVQELGMPAVLVNSSGRTPLPCVDFDFYSCGYQATRYLLEAGHEQVVYVAPDEGEYKSLARQATERQRGFCDCMREFHKNPDFILTLKRFSDTMAAGKRYSAVVANKLSYAFEIYKLCMERGIRIGREIAITCAHYDPEIRFLYPSITCARLPFGEIGRRAAAAALDLSDGKPAPVKTVLPSQIQTSGSA